MDDKTTRLFSALGVLVLVWIVVYWSFPVHNSPVVTTSTDESPPVSPKETKPVPAHAKPSPPAITTPTPPIETHDGTQTGGSPESKSGETPAVIEPRFKTYTVRPGDNFEKIAARTLGDPKLAMAIARANPLQDPSKLRVGQTIRIPLDPDNIQGSPVEQQSRKPPAPKTIEYTVRKGDTLSGIAKSFYGSTRYTDFLFNANKDRLRSRDSLKLGQVLIIPPLPAEARD
ncbi:MAG TPA: LysM peptidoglycan-binding domain-containing protein [Phycisphaerales bacterium]|nr:LysM peptidoglycan-binding domain-containing protein [Phycisphaerales bacterium]